MKRLTTLIILFFLSSMLFTRCGVMFGGSRFTGSIVAKNHPQAMIYANGRPVGTGAAMVEFARSAPVTIELREPGCDPKTQTFGNTFRTGNFALSLVSWGLVGVLIDIGTGAAFKPDHKHNPEIQRMSDKNYIFTVDYPGCATEK